MAVDAERLLRQARLWTAVGEAGRRAAEVRSRQAANAETAQSAYVAVIRALRAELADDENARHGTDELAINELCVLADLANTAARPQIEVAALYEEAAAIADASGRAVLAARVAVDQALWHRDKTRYATALALLLAARDRLAAASLPPQPQIDAVAKVAAAIAETYRWLEDYQRSAQALRAARDEADRLAASGGAGRDLIETWFRSQEVARLRFEQVLLFMDAGRWRQADASFADVDAFLARAGPVGATVQAFYRSRVDAGLGKTDAALAAVEAALPAALVHSWLAGRRAPMLTHYAKLLAAQDRTGEALAAARAAARSAEAAGPSDSEWEAHWQHARLTASIEGVAAALPLYDAALAAIDRARRASLGLRLDSLFLRRRRPVIDAAVLAATAAGDSARAAAYADIAKSRFLAAALYAGPPPRPPTALLDSLDEINAASATATADRLPGLQANRAALVERLRLGRGAMTPPPDDMVAIAGLLDAEGKAALQLFVTDDRQLVTILLHRGAIRHVVRPLSDEAWRGLSAYRANLALPYPSSLNYDPATLIGDASWLAAPELLEQGLAADALIVAPHGLLNILPFSALVFDGRRLFARRPVAQVPCLAAIPALAARGAAAPRLAVFGDPGGDGLRQMERGADVGRSIDAVLAAGRNIAVVQPVIRGAAATVAAFRALAGSAALSGGMLHIACHGRFDAADPDGAGLVCADRLLTAAEIALYPLAALEVTLAACSTGVRPPSAAGVQLRGDDVVGLPAALLEAGSASIIVSVTPAGDEETAVFFGAYYRRRAAGELPLAAFNGAQLAMLADERAPLRRWAGYSFYGVA